MFKRQIKKQQRLDKKKPVKTPSRRDPLLNSLDWQKKPFFKEVAGNSIVYCLVDKNGNIANVKSSWSDEGAETKYFPVVVLFRSRETQAAAAAEFFTGFEIKEIPYQQFLDILLPHFDDNGDFIAINLVGPDFEGPEIAAGEAIGFIQK